MLQISLEAALGILSAMITPAVLIMACGSIILTTSQRLSRIIDRTRRLSTQFQEACKNAGEDPIVREEQALLFALLRWSSSRSRMLQRALTGLYLALGFFLATVVTLGLVAVVGQAYAWAPIALGFGGAALLFYASIVLIFESRAAIRSVDREMDFVIHVGQHYAPERLKRLSQRKSRIFRPDDEEEDDIG